MCTIGVVRLGADDYLVFKNKDFPRLRFDDRLATERDVFGVRGVATWHESDPAEDRFSGMSVGANAAGLLCADANVSGAHDQANYDELVEIALRAGGGVAVGIAAIEAAVATRPYLWGNIVMIDRTGGAEVEVRDQRVAVERVVGPVAQANHHLSLTEAGEKPSNETSESRLASAQRRLESVESFEDVFELLCAHDDGSTGICSHERSRTVYSYVLRRQRKITTMYVAQGNPCESERVELSVPLGERWSEGAVGELRARYPSAQAPTTV